MKKIFAFSVLIVIAFICTSCSITPETPTEGIWYCEKIGISIEFYIDPFYSSCYPRIRSVRLYDNEENYRELEQNWHYSGQLDFCYKDIDGNEIIIYSGFYKYRDNKFILYLHSKGDPNDNYKTQIELDKEECVFVQIDSYDKIKGMKNS